MTPTARPFALLLIAGLLAATAPVLAQRGPAPQTTNLPADVLALACMPTLAYEMPPAPLRIIGGQDSFVRRVYAPGDLITINAGLDNGIEVGQEFYARRVQVQNSRAVTRNSPGVIRTTGWIRVYAVDDRMSLATISHACDTVESGDYLEPFVLPRVPAVSVNPARPQRENYGRILIGTDRRTSFGKGDFMIVDRGSDHGVTPGSQFVVYRDKRQAENFLYDLGEAVAVDVKPETSTLRVTISRDAMAAGDYVALRK
jgi:hypothetical protein